MAGVGRSGREKMETIVLEQQFKKTEKKKKRKPRNCSGLKMANKMSPPKYPKKSILSPTVQDRVLPVIPISINGVTIHLLAQTDHLGVILDFSLFF